MVCVLFFLYKLLSIHYMRISPVEFFYGPLICQYRLQSCVTPMHGSISSQSRIFEKLPSVYITPDTPLLGHFHPKMLSRICDTLLHIKGSGISVIRGNATHLDQEYKIRRKNSKNWTFDKGLTFQSLTIQYLCHSLHTV